MYSFVIIYTDSFAIEHYFNSVDHYMAKIQFDYLIRTRQFAKAIYFYGPEGLINDWSAERANAKSS